MTVRRAIVTLSTPFVLALLAVPLSAHLAVVKTSPASGTTLSTAPERVQVWFNQPPSPRVSHLEVHGPDGPVTLAATDVNREDRSIAAAVSGSLGPGAYEVRWRTAGNDGHVMRGTFAFSIAAKE